MSKYLIARVHCNDEYCDVGPSIVVVPLDAARVRELRDKRARTEELFGADLYSVRVADPRPRWLTLSDYEAWCAAIDVEMPDDEELFNLEWCAVDLEPRHIESLDSAIANLEDRPRVDGDAIVLYDVFVLWSCHGRHDGNLEWESTLVAWTDLEEVLA